MLKKLKITNNHNLRNHTKQRKSLNLLANQNSRLAFLYTTQSTPEI
jgi:hypothetical protein